MVLAYDEATGEQAYKAVKQLFRNETLKWCTVSIAVAGTGTIESITSTPGHKYYLPKNTLNREVGEKQEHASYTGLSEKWVSACNLKAGDKVLLSSGEYGIIQSVKVEALSSPETTYNLEVEDFNTYYVGEQSVCVHNRGCNNLKPDPNAEGPHTTFSRDPKTGQITHYAEWTPNPNNPNGFDLAKRFDGVGGMHTNSLTGERVSVPHMHGGVAPGTALPGGVRSPLPWELPRGY